MEYNNIVRSLVLDDESRIVLTVQNEFSQFLQDPQMKSTLKETIVKVLGDKFKLFEVGGPNCRVTVTEGSEEECLAIIQEEIVKALQMVAMFMNQQN